MRVFVTGARLHRFRNRPRTDRCGSSVLASLARMRVPGHLPRQARSCIGFARRSGELRSGAAAADGVIHAAFIHDFSNYAPAAEADRRHRDTRCRARGFGPSFDRHFWTLVAQSQGPVVTEEDAATPASPQARRGSTRDDLGWRACVGVRLPPSVTEKAITASFRVSSLSPGKGCFGLRGRWAQPLARRA